MSRTSARLALLVLSLAAAAAPAQQDEGGRGRGPFGRRGGFDGLIFLVAVPEIQQELKLKEAQRELLEALQADLRDQRRALFRGGAPPEGADSQARLEEIRARVRDISRQGDELVTMVLDAGQAERLNQLRLQREGVRALQRDEFLQSLGLSQEQLQVIREVREADQRQTGASGAALQERLLAALTDEQKKQWDEMKGESFSFPQWLSRFDQFGRGDR